MNGQHRASDIEREIDAKRRRLEELRTKKEARRHAADAPPAATSPSVGSASAPPDYDQKLAVLEIQNHLLQDRSDRLAEQNQVLKDRSDRLESMVLQLQQQVAAPQKKKDAQSQPEVEGQVAASADPPPPPYAPS